jgi:photosystem II stability/assembly factor-like uncharacterized protein
MDQSRATSVRFQAVSAVDARVVWISGVQGAVARTVDGGATWDSWTVEGPDSLQFRDVHAVDDRTAYLLSAGMGAKSRIYKTTDAGAQWSRQFVNDIPDAFFDCFAFWDATHGVAFSDAVDGAFVIMRTTDGTQWSRVPPAALPPPAEGEGGFAASGTCVTTAGDSTAWIGTGNTSPARVLMTHDRGRTWTAHDAPIVAGEAAGITSVAVWSADTLVAVGGEIGRPEGATNRVARSVDGGESWWEGGQPTFPGAVYGASYVPESAPPILVAVGPGGASFSSDHGTTWTALDSADYWGLGFAAPEAGWLVGPNGRVTKVRFTDAMAAGRR